MSQAATGRRPPSEPGARYGLGFGGFIEGIVLHQVFQWRHMVSDVGDFPVTPLPAWAPPHHHPSQEDTEPWSDHAGRAAPPP